MRFNEYMVWERCKGGYFTQKPSLKQSETCFILDKTSQSPTVTRLFYTDDRGVTAAVIGPVPGLWRRTPGLSSPTQNWSAPRSLWDSAVWIQPCPRYTPSWRRWSGPAPWGGWTALRPDALLSLRLTPRGPRPTVRSATATAPPAEKALRWTFLFQRSVNPTWLIHGPNTRKMN